MSKWVTYSFWHHYLPMCSYRIVVQSYHIITLQSFVPDNCKSCTRTSVWESLPYSVYMNCANICANTRIRTEICARDHILISIRNAQK